MYDNAVQLYAQSMHVLHITVQYGVRHAELYAFDAHEHIFIDPALRAAVTEVRGPRGTSSGHATASRRPRAPIGRGVFRAQLLHSANDRRSWGFQYNVTSVIRAHATAARRVCAAALGGRRCERVVDRAPTVADERRR
jgi:hypothetical protein